MGLCPLVRGIPVRFSETVDRERQIFKHTRGVLTGWELTARERDRVAGSAEEEEIVLTSMPRRLFVTVEGRAWKVRPELEAGVFVVSPVYRQWVRDAEGNAKVRRHGFPVVVDFSGTAHSFTGQTLAASIVDCLEVTAKPKPDEKFKAYCSLSRTRHLHDVLIVQPYAPMLFRLGPEIGPTLLMRFQRGDLAEEEVEEAEAAQKRHGGTTGDTHRQLLAPQPSSPTWPRLLLQLLLALQGYLLKPIRIQTTHHLTDLIWFH